MGVGIDLYDLAMRLCSHICHQDPERSLFIGSIQMPLCYRCLGVYGALLALLAALALARFSPSARRFRLGCVCLLASCMLVALDVYCLQAVLFNNWTRFFSGAFLGASLGFFMWQCLAALFAGRTCFRNDIKYSDGGA